MSKDNIFYEFSDRVVKRYAKVPIHIVSGSRVDPHENRRTIPWVLQTRPENFDVKTKQHTFVYEDEVIELYSKFEVDAFLRLNKNLFELGLLKAYDGEQGRVDTSNTMSDTELMEIANLRSNELFSAALDKITSPLTLLRLKHLATEAGKSIKKIQLIDARIEVLDGDN